MNQCREKKRAPLRDETGQVGNLSPDLCEFALNSSPPASLLMINIEHLLMWEETRGVDAADGYRVFGLMMWSQRAPRSRCSRCCLIKAARKAWSGLCSARKAIRQLLSQPLTTYMLWNVKCKLAKHGPLVMSNAKAFRKMQMWRRESKY